MPTFFLVKKSWQPRYFFQCGLFRSVQVFFRYPRHVLLIGLETPLGNSLASLGLWKITWQSQEWMFMAASYLPLSKEKGSTTDVWDHDRQAERDWDSDVIHADRNFGGRGSRTLRSCSCRSAGWILQVLCVVKVFFYLGCAILGWPVANFGTLLQCTGTLFWIFFLSLFYLSRLIQYPPRWRQLWPGDWLRLRQWWVRRRVEWHRRTQWC